jgi:hypothetical protein
VLEGAAHLVNPIEDLAALFLSRLTSSTITHHMLVLDLKPHEIVALSTHRIVNQERLISSESDSSLGPEAHI